MGLGFIWFAFLIFINCAVFSQQYVISTAAGGAPIPTPIPATEASIRWPFRVAPGPNGDVYVASYDQSIYRIDPRGTLTRIAGNGRSGLSGDGGPATNAQLFNPLGVAVDEAGNIYIADDGNGRVRKIAASGEISTVAGNGSQDDGETGDGGPATSAQLLTVADVAVDAAGNLYLAESFYGRVRRVSPNGTITTVAGKGGSGGNSGDGGPATSAELREPYGLALDKSGNLYIADRGNHNIRRVARNGIITTVAGNGTGGYSGDGGPATSAQLSQPLDLDFDAEGNVFIVDSGNHRIRKIATTGTITTVVGSGISGYAGDGGPATSAELSQPYGVAVDAEGNLFVADTFNHRIRKVSGNGIIRTIAGNGTSRYSGDGGSATNAQISQPQGVAVDSVGTLYIADPDNHCVRKVDADGIITTFAGNGIPGFKGDGGPATEAQLSTPRNVAVDSEGNVYIAEFGNHRIRKVATNGIITTVAGSGVPGYLGDGGLATSARLFQPFGIAVDANGNLYIADTANLRIRKVTPDGIINTVAGTGSKGYSGDGGPANRAQLSGVYKVAVDAAGNLYISSTESAGVRKVSTNGIISTVAGSGGFYSGDGGLATKAGLGLIMGLAVDGGGNLYLGDIHSNRIRKVAANGIITTIAGNGSSAYTGDGGPATRAQLYPWDLTVDAKGAVYVADPLNSAVRLLRPIPSVIAARAAVNAASSLAGALVPGEIVVVFGSGLGPSQLTVARADDQGRYGTDLAGTRAFFNNTPAPILYAWATQVSVVVPYDLGGTNANIQIEYFGTKSETLSVPIASAAPGIFTSNGTGKGQAAAINADGFPNTASRPAARNAFISLYVTGEGQTSPPGVDGQLSASPAPMPVLPVQVTIDGKAAEVSYAGGVPGMVAGFMQVNARVPANSQTGNVPVVVTVGSASSQPGVTIAVAVN